MQNFVLKLSVRGYKQLEADHYDLIVRNITQAAKKILEDHSKELGVTLEIDRTNASRPVFSLSSGRWGAEDTTEMMLDFFEPYLNEVGSMVRTQVVYEDLKDKQPYGYSVVSTHLKKVMDLMVEQGKAKYLRKGRWKILKSNSSKVDALSNVPA